MGYKNITTLSTEMKRFGFPLYSTNGETPNIYYSFWKPAKGLHQSLLVKVTRQELLNGLDLKDLMNKIMNAAHYHGRDYEREKNTTDTCRCDKLKPTCPIQQWNTQRNRFHKGVLD